MKNKYSNFSEKQLIDILNCGNLNHQDFLALREAMERKGMKGMIMCVGSDSDEAQAPIKAAREYLSYHQKIATKVSKKEITQLSKTLLSPKAEIEEKKLAIVTLAHIADQSVFEVLKKYHTRPDKELRVWSELACQECRSFLKSEIFEEATIDIGSLGGTKGDKIRFYFIFKTIDGETVNKTVMKNTDNVLFEAADFFTGEIEKVKYGENFLVASVLLPFEIAPLEFGQAVVNVANRDSFVWHGEFYINNTHLPGKKDIDNFLQPKTVDFSRRS
ncbi:MAG: hypothetical protein V1664_02910 [Candidatus Uhrbacteria bacterium]